MLDLRPRTIAQIRRRDFSLCLYASALLIGSAIYAAISIFHP